MNSHETEGKMNGEKAGKGTFWDRVGMVLSWSCALHCLLSPMLLTFLPMAVHLDEWVHPLLALLVATTGVAAIVHGYRRHQRPWPALLIAFGMGIVFAVFFFHEELHHPAGEPVLNTMGSLFLIFGHYRNQNCC